MIGVGILGTGFARTTQIPCFQATPGIEIVGLLSRNMTRAYDVAQEFGVRRAFDDLDRMLKVDEIELVVVSTPPHQHLPQTLAALKAGKHVLCEKPTALHAGEAWEMWQAAQRAGKLHLLDHELRFNPRRMRMKEMIADGFVGNVWNVDVRLEGPFRADPARAWSWWSDEAQGGGVLGALGSHTVDAVRALLGEIVEVRGHLATMIKTRPDPNTGEPRPVTSDDYAVLWGRLADGGEVSMHLAAAVRDTDSKIAIHGSKGSLRIGENGTLWSRAHGAEAWSEVVCDDAPLPPAGSAVPDTPWARAFLSYAVGPRVPVLRSGDPRRAAAREDHRPRRRHVRGRLEEPARARRGARVRPSRRLDRGRLDRSARMRGRGAGATLALLLACSIAATAPAPAVARDLATSPVEWIEVGDPLLAELDLLVASGLADSAIALTSRPLARRDVAAYVARARRLHPGSSDASLVRLERAFGREFGQAGLPVRADYTSPLLTIEDPGPEGASEDDDPMRLRVSGYVDATLDVTDDLTEFADRSRFGGRADLTAGGLLVHLDLWAGRVDDAASFTDVLVTGSEFAALTEDAYASFATRAFDITAGRRRMAFGPGTTGTLLWSRQAAPVTFLSFGGTLFRHVRATATHADVDASRDARIAAHRLEWFPSPALTIGLHETARYTSSHWDPLYVISLLPYTFVQRLQSEDQVDGSGEAGSIRNNVMAGLDATWHPAPGARLHGELLLDDQNLKTAGSPTRIGYQVGGLWTQPVEALGGGARGRLEAEYSRVYNYVYSTFYGEDFIHHGRPIGYPIGPDSRTLFATAGVSPSANWDASLTALWTDRGEGELGTFFDPDSGAASGSTLSGVVERARMLGAEARFLPRDGVAFTLGVAHSWVADVDHQPGVEERRWIARLGLRLRK